MKKANIMVVEDNELFRDSVSGMLKKSGYHVWTASTGEQALEKLQMQVTNVDLILLDYSLPRLDGLTVLETLRKTSKYIDTPVIVMTALAQRELVIKFGELKVNCYMIKSEFSISELRRQIERIIFKHREGIAADESDKIVLESQTTSRPT